MTFQQGGKGGSPFQTSPVTVEVVLVSRRGSRICVLPESVVAPSSRQSTNTAGITSNPQWVGGTKPGVVTGASIPPVGGGVDHRVAANAGMVGAGEFADPVNH